MKNALLGIFAVLLLVAWLVPLRRAPMSVTFTRGGAVIETADGERIDAAAGMQVSPGDRVVTEDGSVSLDVGDGHQITVSDSSTVSLERGRSTILGSGSSHRLEVEEGKARIQGEAEGRSRLDIGLPNGTAGVRGTSFAVVVGGSSSLISLHQGALGIDPEGAAPVALTPGEGAIVTDAGADVRPLPPRPTIVTPAAGALIEDPAELLTWSAVPGAARYGVEFAADAAFGQLLRLVEVDSTSLAIPALEQDRPVFVRVFALTPEGLEGPASAERTVHLRLRAAQGRALQEAGDIVASIAEFEAALPFYETDVRLLKDLAWSLYVAERHEDSRDVYERARALEPEDFELLVELGRVYFWLEQYEDAEGTYRAALAVAPEDADALWGLADVYRMMDRREEGIELARQALRMSPQHPYASTTLRLLLEGR